MDYHTDHDRRTFRSLVCTFTGVDLQKTACAYDAEKADLSALPAVAFADPIGRKYPVQTKEAAILSIAYFLADKDGEAPTRDRLVKAAKFWGIEDLLASMEKQATVTVTTKCALEISDGTSVQLYFPWHDGASLKQAAEDFYNNRNNLMYEQRKTAATRLMRGAREEKVAFSDEVSHYLDCCCGFGLLADGKAEELLLERKARMGKVASSAISDLATGVRLLHGLPIEKRASAAVELFNAFDEDTGLNRLYGRGVEQPELELIDRSLTKCASDHETVTLQSGHRVRLSDIDWEKVGAFDPVLAQAVGGDLQKAAEVLPTWPRPDAETLVLMLGLKEA